MKLQETLSTLHEMTADQWGLFTTAQAKTRGVSGMDLQRAVRSRQIESVRHGVYRLVGIPHEPVEQLRAAWLALEPSRMAHQRLDDQYPVVVMGPTAAWVHQAGDLQPQPYHFAAPSRRQSRDPEVTFRRRDTSMLKTRLVDGLPVTTLEQTITDLVREHLDLSLVADVLREAALQEDFDLDLLHQLLTAEAPGTEESLLRLAGLDATSMVHQLMGTDLGSLLRYTAFHDTWKTIAGQALPQYGASQALLKTLTPKLQLGGISQDLLGIKNAIQSVELPIFPVIPPDLTRALTAQQLPQLPPAFPDRKTSAPDKEQEAHGTDSSTSSGQASTDDTAAVSLETPTEFSEEDSP
jgi:hypothetical protein